MKAVESADGVIWVASYPKSGNTWMRFVLTHLFMGDVKKSADVDKFIPEAVIVPGYQIKLPDNATTILKTHWEMNPELPFMSKTKGFVYLVRNPLDVMMSLFYFNRLRYYKGTQKLTVQEINESRNRYINAFIQYKGNPLVGDGGGNTSWVNNVTSWMKATAGYPSIVVRYEDMINNPGFEIARVASFFNLSLSDDAVADIVKKTSFKAMKKMEEKEIRNKESGFFYHEGLKAAHDIGSRFMRQGRKGEGKQYIDSHLKQSFFDVFEDTMRLVGYKVNRNTGVVSTTSDSVTPAVSLPYVPEIAPARAILSGVR